MENENENADHEEEGGFDLEALGVLRSILDSRAKRRAALRSSRKEGEDEPLNPWEEEEAPAKKPAAKGEHPMDRYARDGRRKRLP